MNHEIALWILGASVLPILGWGIHMTWQVRTIRTDVLEVKHVLHNPEDYGFGTKKVDEIIRDNTRAMQALTHYIR